MASASPCCYYSLIIITQLLVICVAQENICPFEYAYQLGDSISDTGNLIRIGPVGAFAAARLPYGETFFHRPTGRWSDGLLIIDFFGSDTAGCYTNCSPGNFPVGCFPFALTALPSADPGAYDDLGCLRK
ncbi:hypothetical protein C3L33_13821, partial [Rhododendron williamsianum]